MAGVPSSLGLYPVERELGRGGMGIVYLARDPRLDRAVAIKVLPDALGLNPESLARFEREAKLLASLNHPNIATVYGVEEAHGQRLLVLEYVPGDTLAQKIARGPLPLGEALDLARQIALAVEAAHDGGVIHRDLKPGNVKVTPDGTVKVLDFGLAKNATASDVDLVNSPTITYMPTSTGVILGTAGYMSPEQARGKLVDRRSDIWSFGCVLFECLTGQRIFSGETASDTIAKILEREPDWTALPAQTPLRVRELLRRCLEKDVKKRQRDIGDARLELEAAIANAGVSTSTMAVPAQPPSRSTSWRRTPAIALLAGLLGAALATSLWKLLPPATPSDGGPIRLSLAVPTSIDALAAGSTSDGRTFMMLGSPSTSDGPPTSGFQVYVRRFDESEFKPLEGASDWTTFTVSPDGMWVAGAAPVAPASSQRRLVKVAVDGRTPAVAVVDWDPRWGSHAWLANGDFLITTDAGRSFVRLQRGGGTPTSPIALETGSRSRDDFETVLPQDRGVFVGVSSNEGRRFQQDVWVLDLQTNKTHRVLQDAGSPFYTSATGDIVFTRGSTLMAAPFSLDTLTVTGDIVALSTGVRLLAAGVNPWISLSDNGTLVYAPGSQAELDRQLVIVDQKGAASPLGSERRGFVGLAASPDGHRIATMIPAATGNYEIWITDRDRLFSRRLVSMPNADCFAPTWSADGRSIAFTRRGDDDADGVYVQATDGSDGARLILKAASTVERTAPASWTPDGSVVFVVRALGDKDNTRQLVAVPVRADRQVAPPRILRASPSFSSSGRISPSGKVMSFTSTESGQPEIYVAPYASDGAMGPAIAVSRGSTGAIGWSADGRRLYYDNNGRLMFVIVQEAPVLSASAPAVALDTSNLRFDDYTVLPDGRVVGIQYAENQRIANFTVILNWFDELREKMNAHVKR